MRLWVVLAGIAIASPASAAKVAGLVFDDRNGDGKPSAGEPGIANAVVALGATRFTTSDATGQFELDAGEVKNGIVWVRVPDGFRPGPVWARWDGSNDVDLGLRRLSAPVHGPLTFVVASDTHIGIFEPKDAVDSLARTARLATLLEPAPAFFTILGDVTQGSTTEQYKSVNKALADLEVPWIPVPGNHDWYDGGAAWFAHYGPDNYSFDIAGVHFVVWNMALSADDLRAYLGAELGRVPPTMPIVALTHDPPLPPSIAVLRELGVDYVLTGHTHSNRVVDHGGMIELNTEPLLMGGIDFTPAGYRVVTIDQGRMVSYHRTVVDEPFFALVAPADACVPLRGGELLVAAEHAAAATIVSARLDCATKFELKHVGGWMWRGELPALTSGEHLLELEAQTAGDVVSTHAASIRVCAEVAAAPVVPALAWPQVGGSSSHAGSVAQAIEPPLASRWVTAVGNHVLTAAPVIANGIVYVATTDLGDGDAGGVSALDLATGQFLWRARATKPIRGGLAFVDGLVITTQIDGVVLALDATTGAERWRRAMSSEFSPQAGAVFSAPTVAGDAVFVGHQRAAAALRARDGAVSWAKDPVPAGFNSQSAGAIAIGNGLAIGMFHRELGGVIAWDAKTGALRWRHENRDAVAINAAPVIGEDTVYLVNGSTDVIALDLAGKQRWRTKIDADGFDWGYANVGTPALAGDTLVVPTLYGTLAALDTRTGKERWRYRAAPGPLRGTHYRGKGVPAFVASPVITGGVVWAADTAGGLAALDIRTGLVRWHTALPSPIMAGLAVSGDWLVIAAYDGTVRALTPGFVPPLRGPAPEACAVEPAPANAGCCNAGTSRDTAGVLALACALLRRRRRVA
ncbi:MAG TPA: PQQ-binding-like beta-propeller repeat protein [Kofleriaceae bacterium]